MVDLLVLVKAERFAGWFMSSFSWVVQASSQRDWPYDRAAHLASPHSGRSLAVFSRRRFHRSYHEAGYQSRVLTLVRC